MESRIRRVSGSWRGEFAAAAGGLQSGCGSRDSVPVIVLARCTTFSQIGFIVEHM